ncbi:DUF397 domain-containing protein [Amycolatopsis cihanbeyliensis]|uniref:Uncharacterized protein DUF397 n=1 Tax=Amycolatopsis cihanbeyliensis TaxID=1128664 RepID=A0A542DI44_AMYCI|nr:DUF397 domain-containing protein [Amycolatopsis cihanbeyliensis]TQJ02694.1 uncharacterized protein DUF397 [Amycolatopsis cihanbeyliensis]
MTTADRLAWRTASYSSAGENCVEVAPIADGVVIRHSKHPTAGTITFPFGAWATFVHDARKGLASTNGVAAITTIGTDTVVRSLTTTIELYFDAEEWSAFLAGAADGEFDFTRCLAATT